MNNEEYATIIRRGLFIVARIGLLLDTSVKECKNVKKGVHKTNYWCSPVYKYLGRVRQLAPGNLPE